VVLHALHGLFAYAAVQGAAAACAWQPGEVLEVSGKVETGGLTGRLVLRVETGTGRLFEEDDLGIVRTGTGFDGSVAWSQDKSGGVHDLNSPFARRLARSIAWLDGQHGCPSPRGAGVTPLASRTEHNRRFARWKVTPAGGAPFELWFDARTGRADRALFQTAETRLIRHFADWRDVGAKRWVAFEQRDEYPEDEDEVVRKITHAAVRKAAARGDFDRPRPPDDAAILHGAQSTTVAFDDDHRTRIFVPVFLNGKGPFAFELDNGGHNILTAETAEAIGLTGAGSFSSTGAGDSVVQAGIARVARIQIGDAVLTDQAVSIREFKPSSNDRTPDPPRAGVLGLELFERFVVAIDARRNTVTLSRFGSNIRPGGTPIPLVFAEDAPLIEGSYLGHRGDFMLDTGNAGPTIIEDYWARLLGLSAALDKGVPRGNIKVSIGAVGVGPFRLRDELVSFYGPAERGSEYSRAVAGVYGEPLLSRFNATYDYSRSTVWLDPLPDVGPLAFNGSGLALDKVDGGAFKVAAVVPGSPADETGIRVDDMIDAINGVPAGTLSRADAAAFMREKAGTTISLYGEFGGVEGQKTLILRDLMR
jgi:hypothetical protein